MPRPTGGAPTTAADQPQAKATDNPVTTEPATQAPTATLRIGADTDPVMLRGASVDLGGRAIH